MLGQQAATLDRFSTELANQEYCELPVRRAIALICERRERILAERRAAIADGTLKPKVRKKKAPKHNPEWVKAKKLCRLNQDDIRKAKELGIGPKSLIKNIPNRNQQWKLPVKDWIAELYEKRFGSRPSTEKPRAQSHHDASDSHDYSTAFEAYLNEDFVALHAFECERDRHLQSQSDGPTDDCDDIPF